MLSANSEKIKCTSYVILCLNLQGVDFMFKLSNLFDQIASMCRLAALDLTKNIAVKEETNKFYRERYLRTQDEEEEVQHYRKYIKRDTSRSQQARRKKRVIEDKSVQSSEEQQEQNYPKRSFYRARKQVRRVSKGKNQRKRKNSFTQQKQPANRRQSVKTSSRAPTPIIYARRTSPIAIQHREAQDKVEKQASNDQRKIRNKKEKSERKPVIKNWRQLKKLGITLSNVAEKQKKSEQSSEYSEIKKLDSEVLYEQQKIVQEKHVQAQKESEQKAEQDIQQEQKVDEKPQPQPSSKTQFKPTSILLRAQSKQESKPQTQQSSSTLQLIQMKPHQIFSRNSSRSAPVGISRKVPLHGNMKLMLSSEESSEPSDYKSRSKTKKQSRLKKSSKSARRSRKAKRPEGQVKRPTNSFMMFLKEVKQRLRKDYNVFKAKELSQAASKQWKLLTPQQKQHYKIMASNKHKRELQEAILKKVLLSQNASIQEDPAVIMNRSISIDSKEQKPKTTVNKKPRSESDHDESNTAKEEEEDESSSSSSSDEEGDDQSMSNSNDQDNPNSNSESSSHQKDQTISQQEAKRKSKKDADMKKEGKKTVETKH